jgi:hypothetical protein
MCGGPFEMDIGQGEVPWLVFADPDGTRAVFSPAVSGRAGR